MQSCFGVLACGRPRAIKKEGRGGVCSYNSIAGRIDQELWKHFKVCFAGIFNPCALEIELPIDTKPHGRQ